MCAVLLVCCRQMKRSEFYNEADCPFEVKGFFEEFLEIETNKVLGIRYIKEPDRRLGSDGRIVVVLTENTELVKGHRTVLYKCSKEKPRRCFAMIQFLCGRSLANLAAEKAGTFYPK